jgi:hypothetical protein
MGAAFPLSASMAPMARRTRTAICSCVPSESRPKASVRWRLIPVMAIVIAGLSPARRRALAIADNKIAANAGWDRERLAIEIPELADLLNAEGLDVSILGFEPVEIDQLQTDFEEHGTDPQDNIEPNWWRAVAVSKPDDLWALGNHKGTPGRHGSRSSGERCLQHSAHRRREALAASIRDVGALL